MSLIFVYITNPSKEDAIKIAKHLLEKRLIACANIMPISSLYWWEGKIAEENEFLLIGKTTAEKFEQVKEAVKQIHPYRIPCIAKIDVEANKEFEAWLKKETE
ncbi:MAG: divalent-cation tolerance protein CutA [Candidatus Iainarchaeum archaeon]|uniref:Divalent-cation tolerance protein CutA n=1 Tax=Candidatus Iainarchaeum sp. TaxID=3101447 RepID=A0A497JJL1_9ARCH|nr:MAG: divalent-cation tolerance protein CutA [Candidatus Diapherotrites archaeon]